MIRVRTQTNGFDTPQPTARTLLNDSFIMSYFVKWIALIIFVGLSSCEGVREGIESFTQSADCGDRNFKHKSEAEIAALSPEEKMDQMVLEQMFHIPSGGDSNYEWLHRYLVQDGAKILPRAVEYMNTYDPKASECRYRTNARLLTAAMYAHLIDTAKVRLRAIEPGRNAIDALEQAIERRRKVDINIEQHSTRTNLLTHFLTEIRGLCIKDRLILGALKERHGIQMSESEMSVFSNFLITLDPAYPSWTTVIGSAEMTLEESDKYYQAYLKFMKSKE